MNYVYTIVQVKLQLYREDFIFPIVFPQTSGRLPRPGRRPVRWRGPSCGGACWPRQSGSRSGWLWTRPGWRTRSWTVPGQHWPWCSRSWRCQSWRPPCPRSTSCRTGAWSASCLPGPPAGSVSPVSPVSTAESPCTRQERTAPGPPGPPPGWPGGSGRREGRGSSWRCCLWGGEGGSDYITPNWVFYNPRTIYRFHLL